MKDDLFALCEKRGRKVNELADLLAKQLGRHPRSPEILEEVEQLLDNWADVTLRESQPRTELQRLFSAVPRTRRAHPRPRRKTQWQFGLTREIVTGRRQ